jgi:hypothetical protein
MKGETMITTKVYRYHGFAALTVIIGLCLLASIPAGAAEFKVVAQYDFEDGTPQGAEATNGGTLEVAKDDTFDGHGAALRTANDKEYLGMSWYQRTALKEQGTTLCFAYKLTGGKGNLVVQCQSATGGNLHAEIKTTVRDTWAVAVVDLGKLTDWGGKFPNSKGHEFRNIQIYTGLDGTKGILVVDNVMAFDGEDRTPPAAPAGMAATIADYRVRLTWERAGEATFPVQYELYRGTRPDFTPSTDNLVGRTCRLEAFDDTISNFGTFYYQVRAVDVSGNAGACSPALAVKVAE